MFNPQMMGMGNIPNVPSVEELWKQEKSKYRQWIILFAIGIVTLLVLAIIAFVFDVVNIDDQAQKMITRQKNDPKVKTIFSTQEARGNIIGYAIIPSSLSVLALFIGVFLYFKTTIEAYKQKNMARISQWSTLVVGVAAAMSGFFLLTLSWRGGVGTYLVSTKSGIYNIIFKILSILVWMLISIPLGRIRNTFLLSERIQKLKSDPNYQNMQSQMQQMFSGQLNNSGPFAPRATNPNDKPSYQQPKAQTPPPKQENTPQIPIVKKVINSKKVKLEAMSWAELKSVAKELSISGYNQMKKDELIDAILRVTNN